MAVADFADFANLTHAGFLAKARQLTGVQFAWQDVRHATDPARQQAAQWAFRCLDGTWCGWGYHRKSWWWGATDREIFEQEYGGPHRCLECDVDLGLHNPRQLCGKTCCLGCPGW